MSSEDVVGNALAGGTGKDADTIDKIQFSALTGASGFVVGGVSGVLRSVPAGPAALALGIQWGLTGAAYGFTRDIALRAIRDQSPSLPPAEQKVNASSISGAVAGGLVGLGLRGPRSILSGALVYGGLGYVGQTIFNNLDAQRTLSIRQQVPLPADAQSPAALADQSSVPQQPPKPANWLQRIARSRFSPMSELSDEKYEAMLEEKLVQLEADIALIDERIERLRQQGTGAMARRDDGKDGV